MTSRTLGLIGDSLTIIKWRKKGESINVLEEMYICKEKNKDCNNMIKEQHRFDSEMG